MASEDRRLRGMLNRALILAESSERPREFTHDGVSITVYPGQTLEQALECYESERKNQAQ